MNDHDTWYRTRHDAQAGLTLTQTVQALPPLQAWMTHA
jgi:hypothetical protein